MTPAQIQRLKSLPGFDGLNEGPVTRIFSWNPDAWTWTELPNVYAEIAALGSHTTIWTCHTKITPGDPFYFYVKGVGIIGSGRVTSQRFDSPHWNGNGKMLKRVRLTFDKLIPIDRALVLKGTRLAPVAVAAQMSGGVINKKFLEELDAAWTR